MDPATGIARPGTSAKAAGKPQRPAKADGFKQAMARAMDGAGPPAPAAQLRPRPASLAGAAPAAPAGRPRPADAAFRDRIALLESNARGPGQGLAARNPGSGALGRYQLTPQALQDLGWQDAGGAWTRVAAGHGVRSAADFLAAPAAQEAAMAAYLRRAEQQLGRNGSLARSGGAVSGLDGQAVPLTEAGLVAAAHRRGAASVARYLQHRSTTPEAPLSPAQRSSFAAVERRLRDFAALPYALATRAAPRDPAG
ncbi:hypothetical protein ACFQY5_10325 [Paeniroseomonas aquatica]|uniref:Phage tail lysozyme domain-containing protein n=1 Tax=Paeniroseomonas aquatica TaxID=373043 RepID=A0ABT8A7Z6_9PROT|nr:hypothetical protein [Paeniroseomonas aquatica]MDN3565907.1 hypothetical protein [Paeniroseomonas aquatica]